MALRLEDFGTRGQAPGMASVDHANDRFDLSHGVIPSRVVAIVEPVDGMVDGGHPRRLSAGAEIF